jgi:hypothetical protein
VLCATRKAAGGWLYQFCAFVPPVAATLFSSTCDDGRKYVLVVHSVSSA